MQERGRRDEQRARARGGGRVGRRNGVMDAASALREARPLILAPAVETSVTC